MSLSAAQKAAQKIREKRVGPISARRQNGNEKGHLADAERIAQLYDYGYCGNSGRHGDYCRIGCRIRAIVSIASQRNRLGG